MLLARESALRTIDADLVSFSPHSGVLRRQQFVIAIAFHTHRWQLLGSKLPRKKYCYWRLHRRLVRLYRLRSAMNCSAVWQRQSWPSPNTSQVSLVSAGTVQMNIVYLKILFCFVKEVALRHAHNFAHKLLTITRRANPPPQCAARRGQIHKNGLSWHACDPSKITWLQRLQLKAYQLSHW